MGKIWSAIRYSPVIYYPLIMGRWFWAEAAAKIMPADFDYWFWGYIVGAYLVGSLIRDTSAPVWQWLKSLFVAFRVYSSTPENSDQFDNVSDQQNLNNLIMAFSVENKAWRRIEGIEIVALISSRANNHGKTDPQESYRINLRFTDGSTALNSGRSKPVCLAHQKIDTGKMFFGEPDHPSQEILPGMYYKGELEVSGKGTFTKKVEFLIEGIQQSNPVFRLRYMMADKYDEE
jgi:hypothetical protein